MEKEADEDLKLREINYEFVPDKMIKKLYKGKVQMKYGLEEKSLYDIYEALKTFWSLSFDQPRSLRTHDMPILKY